MAVFEVVLGTVAMVSILACATVLPAMDILAARTSRPRRGRSRQAQNTLPDKTESRYGTPSVPAR